MALSLGIASAANPTWIVVNSQQVKVAPSIVGDVVPFAEGPDAFFVEANGQYYIGLLDNERAKAQFDLAQHAMAGGKRITVLFDPDLTINYTYCADWNADGCIVKGRATAYKKILELAISP
jgi:hypothetical protein